MTRMMSQRSRLIGQSDVALPWDLDFKICAYFGMYVQISVNLHFNEMSHCNRYEIQMNTNMKSKCLSHLHFIIYVQWTFHHNIIKSIP